jgi:uncharacterized protein with HEPN domain
MSKRAAQLYLDDILSSIIAIEEFTKGMTFEDFQNDRKTVDAVIRNLEIIGEAANNIPQELKNSYSIIPWRDMISMRNKIMHEYFGVDTEIMWKTIQEDLPSLKTKIESLSLPNTRS